jgi:glucose/mannose transport system substrate-binding protein
MKDASRQLPDSEMLATPDTIGAVQDVLTKLWNTNQSVDDAAKALAVALKT